ncbi:hypothetical protein [Ferrimicrobium sp.]|uniref:hypothetical protein n=1 Tax=Ferrimicrobium sp. TaxID=2926050 RepID=UPI0026023DBF|nr:hypothetical protein [Ferrimicrobium sp.]
MRRWRLPIPKRRLDEHRAMMEADITKRAPSIYDWSAESKQMIPNTVSVAQWWMRE